MNNEVIAAFQASTSDVFQTMLGKEITGGQPLTPQCLTNRGVSGMIGLTGKISGDVIVSFDQRIAIFATTTLLGQVPKGLDTDVVDAVGELTNMIAGSAKGKLEKYDMTLALPTVIMGDGHRIGFNSGVKPVSLPFTCEWGEFSIELGLTEVKVPSCVC